LEAISQLDDDRVAVETPEHVTLSYEVAGAGSRMIASLLDHLIIVLIILAMALVAVSLQFTAAGTAALAIIIGGPLLLLALYFTIFEAWWSGQTPGKRAAGLRVMRDDGTPVSVIDVIIRNTVRLVDFLPYLYFVGGVVSFFQKHGKRVGDLAAGTVVVKLRESSLPEAARPSVAIGGGPDDLTRLVRSAALSISPAELSSIRRFLDRRFELTGDVRARLGREMLATVRDKLPAEAATIGEQRPETVLEALVRACAQRGERF
jgi:uncharacterized RDD family membrane protein YckC